MMRGEMICEEMMLGRMMLGSLIRQLLRTSNDGG